jgi:hypothetical protein
MAYNKAVTEWPASAKNLEDVKPLIDRFFALLDNDGADVGDQLADEVFMNDGQLVSPVGKATGSSGKRSNTTGLIRNETDWQTRPGNQKFAPVGKMLRIWLCSENIQFGAFIVTAIKPLI